MRFFASRMSQWKRSLERETTSTQHFLALQSHFKHFNILYIF